VKLFARKGVDGTSMRDIVGEAGISLGAVYNHYASKDELAHKLFAEAWSRMARDLRQAAQQGTSLEEKLTRMIDYVFRLLEEEPDLISFVYLQRHRNLQRLDMRSQNPYLVFNLVIHDAIIKGEIPRQEIDLATSMVMGSIVQIIDVSLLGHLKKRPRAEMVAQVTAGALGCLRRGG
jgi:AcrR family transcriptional regulator